MREREGEREGERVCDCMFISIVKRRILML